MKKDEFLKRTTSLGIDVNVLNIFIDEISTVPNSFSAIQEGKRWNIYATHRTDAPKKLYTATEGMVFTYLSQMVRKIIKTCGYLNDSITMDLVLTDYDELIEKMDSTCTIDPSDLSDEWENLTRDLRIMNEVKYYVLNGNFVPEKDAYVINSITAKEICEKQDVTPLEAFTIMMDLDR